MANVRHQRIALLEQRGPNFRGIGRFADWLAQNRNLFRGNVYGPVVAEVNVADNVPCAHPGAGCQLCAPLIDSYQNGNGSKAAAPASLAAEPGRA